MICSICRQGETNPGTTTVTLERGELTFVAKDVLAMVWANCGEEYLDSSTIEQVLRMAEEAAASGVQVDIRALRAAQTTGRKDAPSRTIVNCVTLLSPN